MLQSNMYDYPGLGLPLRYNEQIGYDHYPIGAHGNNPGSNSLPIFVRELAMMDVMEKLTDKAQWNTKVFDDKIVGKWKNEALAIPNKELYSLATSGKDASFGHDEIQSGHQSDDMLDSILNERAFDYVSIAARHDDMLRLICE